MKRKIVKIDEEKCNGCGLCVNACHEGALQLINGKAKLVSEAYCDGLGACLPDCPAGAIELEEREAVAFDEEAVKRNLGAAIKQPQPLLCGCPGSMTKELKSAAAEPTSECNKTLHVDVKSQLRQWPCQIKLVPANAPYFDNAHLLIAADCSAYAYGSIHQDFMRNKITLIGCPKLDNINYAQKLTEILKAHDIKSITVLRMEVPCCGGIVAAVKEALKESGSLIPWRVVTISTDGQIIED
jgi:NAD-dependent dihydropyrimidine dehydrogenase PreA subunit